MDGKMGRWEGRWMVGELNELMKSCEIEELGYDFTSPLYGLCWGNSSPEGNSCKLSHFAGLGEELSWGLGTNSSV